MTAKEAYSRALNWYEDDEEPVPVVCRDYKKFYGFIFAPKGTKEGDRVFVGGEMICVYKDTGRVEQNDYSDICDKEYGLFVDLKELK